jgi:hypothetical protein
MPTFFSQKQAGAMETIAYSILPVQFFVEATHLRSGEQRLMHGVLNEALTTISTYYPSEQPSGKRLFSEAYEWVMSDDQFWLYSFESVCAHLYLEPGHIRKLVRIQYGPYYAPPKPSSTYNRYPIPQQNYILRGVTCVREAEKDPARRYDHAGLIVKLATGKMIKVPYSTIRGPWLRIGQTGNLTVALHFALAKGIAPDAPMRTRTRHLVESSRQHREFLSA